MAWLTKREHRVIVTCHILKPTSRKMRGATPASRKAPGGQRGYYAWCDCGWHTSPRVKDLRGPFFPLGYFSAITEDGGRGVAGSLHCKLWLPQRSDSIEAYQRAAT